MASLLLPLRMHHISPRWHPLRALGTMRVRPPSGSQPLGQVLGVRLLSAGQSSFRNNIKLLEDFFESLWIAVRLVYHNTMQPAHGAYTSQHCMRKQICETLTCTISVHVHLHT